MKPAASLAFDQLAALFGDEARATLRRLSERPVSVQSAAAQRAVWAALAGAGWLRADDLSVVLPAVELMGESLYQSPYLDTLLAIDALSALDEPQPRQSMRDGEIAVAVAHQNLRFVRNAELADLLLVVSGATLALFDLKHLPIRERCDLGRGSLFEVSLDPPASPVLTTRSVAWDAALDRARLRQAAYLTGLCRGSLDLAVTYARQRTLFGRTLAAHQAPAFRLAALAARREAVRSLIYRGERAAESLRLAADLAVDTASETLQIHGACGLLDASDAQLFYRRALTEAALTEALE